MTAELKLFIIFLIAGFAFGFHLGRKAGIKEGKAMGLALAPLELKRQSFEKGKCQICGERVTNEPENGIIVDIKDGESI